MGRSFGMSQSIGRGSQQSEIAFAGQYTQTVTLADLLKPQVLQSISRRATGEQYLVVPATDLTGTSGRRPHRSHACRRVCTGKSGDDEAAQYGPVAPHVAVTVL